MSDAAPDLAAVPGTAPSERKWAKILLALAAFFVVPIWLRGFLPVEDTVLLFVPALAACCLVGWWAGGRALLAIVWVGLAAWLAWHGVAPNDAFSNMLRGWTLLLAGAFGLVCLFGTAGAFFPKALSALGLTLALSLLMSLFGPVRATEARKIVAEELSRRNAATMASVTKLIGENPDVWQWLSDRLPPATDVPAETEKQLKAISTAGLAVFPALLALESVLALALAWTMYHRLGRARLGPPLGLLRDFRFNDQLIWGLIVGLTVVFLPTLSSLRGLGLNLLVFFGALYALRGLAVLSWFLPPVVFIAAITLVSALAIWSPVFGTVAVLGVMFLVVTSFGLGLGDTWADWRNRARPTT
jgi:Predicted membrane protein (DUF2232)